MPHDPKSHVQSLEWRSFGVRIVVTGSLAYDYIMNFPGNFKDHILEDKAHVLSVSFLIDSMHRMRGGVAGNIAYTLALLGERPLVVASAGGDFGEYRKWMEQQGIDAGGIAEIEEDFTASCFINTDESNNKIVAFYPGAMGEAKNLSLLDLGLGEEDLVVISPTDPEAMSRYAEDGGKVEIPIAPISKLTGPTGAGDAYIGGFVFGLARGFSLEVAGRVAALAGAYAIEHQGCQEHHYTPEEFVERYEGAFGPSPEV